MLRGIDVSSHQPTIDWGRVAVDYGFAIIKATGGAWYRNPEYAAQLAGARAAGLVVGHYHFAHEGEDPGPGAAAEADYFLAHADVRPGELVALDIEDTGVGGDLSGWALAWLERVGAALGCRPLLYSYPDYIRTRGLGTPALAAYPLWFASYRTPYAMQPWPSAPGRWGRIAIWQWSGGTAVPGIPNDTDDNLTGLTREGLIALGRPGAAPAPAGVVTERIDWGGAGEVVASAEYVVVRNPATGRVYCRRRTDGTLGEWVELTREG